MKMGSFVGWSCLIVALLPAWAVKSAGNGSRLGWLITVLLLGFAGLMGGLIAKAAPKSPPISADLHSTRYGPFLAGTLAVCALTAIFSSIAFTYAEPDNGFLGDLASLVSYLGSHTFPVIARYATDLQPPLPAARLLQVQSIMSIVLLASLPCFGACAGCWFLISPAERRSLLESSGREHLSEPAVIGVVSFAILMWAGAYFGWGEFKLRPEAPYKYCPIEAACYAHGNDLLILAAAGMKLVAIIVFPLGALVTVMANRVLAAR